jgi:hypothetical protein
VNISAPVGSLTLAGLPFTVLAPAAAISIRGSNLAGLTNESLQGFANDGSTTVILEKFINGVSADLAGNVQVGTNFMITATYFV